MTAIEIEGPGVIVATDNGDPTNMTPFPFHERRAFNDMALVIVRSVDAEVGTITVRARSGELAEVVVNIVCR